MFIDLKPGQSIQLGVNVVLTVLEVEGSRILIAVTGLDPGAGGEEAHESKRAGPEAVPAIT